MNIWRNFRLFSQRLPTEVWPAISLLCILFSVGTIQITRQRKAARNAAIQRLTVTLKARDAELDQIKRDLGVLKKRGNVTDEERRSIRKRLDEQNRKSEIVRTELEKIIRY